MGSRTRASRRAWVVGWAFALTAGIAALWLWWPHAGSGPVTHRAAPRVVAIGTPGRAAALWAFSDLTYRMAPDDLTDVGVLATQAFGQFARTRGYVYFYEPGQGRFGVLDAQRNEIADLAPFPPGDPDAAYDAVAVTEQAVWVRTAPQVVTRVDRATHRERSTVDLPLAASEPARLVGVAAGIVAVGRADDGRVATTLVPDAGGEPAPLRPIAATGAVDLVAADAEHVWVNTRARVVQIDARRGTVQRAFAVAPDVVAMDAFAGTLYLLTADAALLRVVPGGQAEPVLGNLAPRAARPLRPPANVVAAADGVYALVRDDVTADGHHVAIYRITPGSAPEKVTFRSDVFVGAITTT